MGTPPEFRKLNFRILTDLKSKEKNSNRKAKIKKMSISIKTILHRGPNEETLPRKEIRRFEIEENVNGSYDFLRAKIISLYPDMTLETPFRLMWTDEEGDNVCFSTDEELAQALKFVKAQENQLFKVIIKTPQVQQEQAQAGANQSRAKNNSQPDFGAFARSAAEFGEQIGNQFGANFCRQFGDQSNAWNTNQMNGKKAEKMAQKMGKKCEKMKAKQQFHEEKARMLNEMIKNINPNMQQHIQALINGNNVANMTARDNGDIDIAVDIPINRSTSSSSTSTSSTTTTTTTTPNTAQKQPEKMDQSNNVYPDLNQSSAPMEEDFTDVTEDVNRARMNEAMKKMAELGFEGEWVKTLLESCNCDIAKAVEKMNPESK